MRLKMLDIVCRGCNSLSFPLDLSKNMCLLLFTMINQFFLTKPPSPRDAEPGAFLCWRPAKVSPVTI
jgi:hypothetical protein